MIDYQFDNSLDYAEKADQEDSIRKAKDEFIFPKDNYGNDVIYLCGNSLGLQSKPANDWIDTVTKDWREYAVRGHFHSDNPWTKFHESLADDSVNLFGAKAHEIVYMNTLTVNLHLLMVSFYKPTKHKYKVLMEKKPFPSDVYAVKSQLSFHGFDENDGIVFTESDGSNNITSTESFISTIEKHHEELALILLGSVNYYSGQFFDIQKISATAQKFGIPIGLDCAHAAGNVKLNLHKDNIDFAVWCTYKYMNSGPGAIAGAFIHEKHHEENNINRFEGWWGYNKEKRFQMTNEFLPINSAEAWNISNPPILSMAPIKASLDIFNRYTFDSIISKSKKLSSYMKFMIDSELSELVELRSPSDQKDRGCQLSLHFKGKDKSFHEKITKSGIITDWREPGIVRVAPTPLYTSFKDVHQFIHRIKDII